MATSAHKSTRWLHMWLLLTCVPASMQLMQPEPIGMSEIQDVRSRVAVRRFRKPATGAWLYTAATRKGQSMKYFYAGLTVSISSLMQHNTEYPVIALLDGEIDPHVPEVLKALGVQQVLEVEKDLRHKFPTVAEAIDRANKAAPEHYFGCFNKIWAWALNEFEKVVTVDLDVVFWQNPDNAMWFPELSAVNDYGMSLGNPSAEWFKAFQAGIMTLEPRLSTLEEIASLLANHLDHDKGLGDLPEQHVLNEYFNLLWFEMPVGYNIQPTQIPYEAYKGVYSIHHVAWWKDDFYRSLEKCETEADCKECCRRAVKARLHGLEKLEKAGVARHFVHALHH